MSGNDPLLKTLRRKHLELKNRESRCRGTAAPSNRVSLVEGGAARNIHAAAYDGIRHAMRI